MLEFDGDVVEDHGEMDYLDYTSWRKRGEIFKIFGENYSNILIKVREV